MNLHVLTSKSMRLNQENLHDILQLTFEEYKNWIEVSSNKKLSHKNDYFNR